MRWLSDDCKLLFQGVAGGASVSMLGYLLRRWYESWRKLTGRHASMGGEAKISSVVNSHIANAQSNLALNAQNIRAKTLNITSSVQTASRVSFVAFPVIIVAGVIAAAGFVYRARAPEANTPMPIRDSHGHPRTGEANRYEFDVTEKQDDISDSIEYKDRVDISAYNRNKLKDEAYLAGTMLAINDADLRLRYRFVKYAYAAFAFEMAAVYVENDGPAKVAEYSKRAIENADIALSILPETERTYATNQESRILLDWVNRDDSGKDRVLYIKADATCLLGKAQNDPALKSQAFKTWQQIGLAYRTDFPSKGTPELKGCVPSTESK